MAVPTTSQVRALAQIKFGGAVIWGHSLNDKYASVALDAAGPMHRRLNIATVRALVKHGWIAEHPPGDEFSMPTLQLTVEGRTVLGEHPEVLASAGREHADFEAASHGFSIREDPLEEVTLDTWASGIDWSARGLAEAGFVGFVGFKDLPHAKPARDAGVYCVTRASAKEPAFLPLSTGAMFQGRDPSVAQDVLQANWVPGTEVLYIGKASTRGNGRGGIATRLSEYRRFGQGQHVGHWGGRYIWQLSNSDDLRVAWIRTPEVDPALIESVLLEAFADRYGALPFANLRH